MIIAYNEEKIIKDRKDKAQSILGSLPYRYCFITGSFLFKQKYKDIDVFVISRSKIKPAALNKKIKIQVLDFNDLYSLFYHSISKCCLAKNILPEKPIKATLANLWSVINDSVPSILNEKKNFRKEARSAVLYIQYFKTQKVLDSIELKEFCDKFNNSDEVLEYITEEMPKITNGNAEKSYIKKFFYTQAGFYKKHLIYEGQKFLYALSHSIANG